jgi:hypothetical protein
VIKTDTIQIYAELTALLSELDEFKEEWAICSTQQGEVIASFITGNVGDKA